MLSKSKNIAIGIFVALALVFAVSVASGVGPVTVDSIEAAKPAKDGGDRADKVDKGDKGDKGGGGLRWTGID